MYTIGIKPDNAPLNLTADQRRRHIYTPGKTGTGKTTLLHNLMCADLRAGAPFAFFDPHGDEAQRIIDNVQRDRVEQVIYFDPLDEAVPCFNPLDQPGPRHAIAENVVNAMYTIWPDSWGERMHYLLLNSVRLLLEHDGTTLMHLPRLIADTEYRSKLLEGCTDPFTNFFWHMEYPGWDKSTKQYAWIAVQNKVGQLTGNPYINAVLTGPSTIIPRTIMDEGRVFVANLSKRMGEKPSYLLGALLLSAFSQAAQDRAEQAEEERTDYTLYVDEFQNFATDTFATVLSEARKYRLNLVIANQYLDQLRDGRRGTNLGPAVFGNVGTVISFRLGARDARQVGEELDVPHEMLRDLPNREALVTTLRGGMPTPAVRVCTEPPYQASTNRSRPVRQYSRDRFARPRSEVQRRVRDALYG